MAGVGPAQRRDRPTSTVLVPGPPYRVKTATQPAFVPGAISTKAQTLGAWDGWHNDLDNLILRSDGFALDRPMIASPFDPKGKMRYSVYAGVLIVAAHERRHLWQASPPFSGRLRRRESCP